MKFLFQFCVLTNSIHLCMNVYYLPWIPSQEGEHFIRRKPLPRRPNSRNSTHGTAAPGRRVWTVPPARVHRVRTNPKRQEQTASALGRVLSPSLIIPSSSRLQTPTTCQVPCEVLGTHPARTDRVPAPPWRPQPHQGGGPQTRMQRNRIIPSGSEGCEGKAGGWAERGSPEG